MIPLKLETMALREVITKAGLCSDYTGLMVPRMRQELEQLARLPGDCEIVAEEITVATMDGREVSSEDWRRRTQNGKRISITCEARMKWRVMMEGLGNHDMFLDSNTQHCCHNNVAFFDRGFIEDGVLKRQLWMGQGAGNKTVALKGVKAARLDAKGDLVWTSSSIRDWKGEMMEVLQVVRAKRVGG